MRRLIILALLGIAVIIVGCNSKPIRMEDSKIKPSKMEEKTEIEKEIEKLAGVIKEKKEQEIKTKEQNKLKLENTVNLEKTQIKEETIEDIVVEVEGIGAIDKDYSKSRDEAIWDAQRRAVEKGVGMFLSSDTLVSNSQLIENNIYTQVNGYVENYEVLEENQGEYLYTVKIKASVKKINLRDKLFRIGLIKKVGDPRIMVIVPEYREEKRVEKPAVETEIIKYFVEAGYRIVDQNQIEKIRYSEEAKEISEGNSELAKQVATQYGADILIVGKAFSVDNGEINGMRSSSAQLSIRGIKVDNGEIIFADTLNTATYDITEKMASQKALRKVGELAATGGRELRGRKIKPLIVRLAETLLQKPSIQLVFSGISNTQYMEISNKLKEERSVKNAFKREYSGNIGRIDIDYVRGIDNLQTLLKDILDFEFEITKSTKNKLFLNVIAPIEIYLKYSSGFKDFEDLIKNIENIESIGKGKIIKKELNENSCNLKILVTDNIVDIAKYLSGNYIVENVSENKIIIKK